MYCIVIFHNLWTIRVLHNVWNNWFVFPGDTIELSLTSVRGIVRWPCFTSVARFRTDGAAIPFRPMDITDYELKKILPTQAQLAKCYADAEAQFAAATSKSKKGKVVK